MPESLQNKTVKGVIWVTIEQFVVMAMQFIVNVILARLLIPADFGAIGMLTIFMAISNTLIDSGFTSALIQNKHNTQTDYSTIFYFNIIFSLLLYFILFFISPLIADFYNLPVLKNVLRVWGINLILGALQSIQLTRLRKDLQFKKLAFNSILSYIVGAIVGILLAYHGLGVWSLVLMYIVTFVTANIILWLIYRWHPVLDFSVNALKKLFSFGGYLMISSLIVQIVNNIQSVVIGKRFSASELGLYTQADKLGVITNYSIPFIIVKVMYPVFAKVQNEREKLQQIYFMNIRVISYLIYPLLAILVVVSQPLIISLYGYKWLISATYFKIICVGGFFMSLQNLSFHLIASLGLSKILFKTGLYKSGILLLCIFIGLIWGIYGLLWGIVVNNLLNLLINFIIIHLHTGYRLIEQVNQLLPSFLLCAIGLFGSDLLTQWGLNPIYVGLLFLVYYLFMSYIFKFTSLKDTVFLIKSLVGKK